MNLSEWAFKNSKLVYFFIFILTVGGVISAYNMSKLEDPEIKVKQALVITTYPGASAHQVELEVTDVLEKSIRTMPDLHHVQSSSYNDLSIIEVELKTTVSNADVEQHYDILRRKVSNAVLPNEAGQPMVRDDFGDVYGIFYALTGDGLKDREMEDYAELVRRELLTIDGVERVELYGGRQECINISLREDRMANLGVSTVEVLMTLRNQNAAVYSGYYANGDNRLRVSVGDKFNNVEDIAAMLIQGHDDDQLRLSDIATVEKDYVTPTRNQLTYDRQQAIGILVASSSGTDILKVGKAVAKRIAEIEKTRLPAGVEFHKVFYQPERVGDALGTFAINLIESIAIVIVILMLFMGFRSGVIIGISLLITVLGTFTFLGGMDGTLQRVSLASFIMAMGMLVDNAIVIVDGVLVDLKAGKPRMQALTDIGKQTAMPLLGATLIAILAFWPLYLSPDTAGVYVRDLFIVLAVSLLLSWLLALFHVPLMCDHQLPQQKSDNQDTADKEPYKGPFYAALRSALRFGLHYRTGFVIIMAALLALSIWGFKFMKKGFFPDMNYDQLYMEYKLPEGSSNIRVEKDLQEIQEYLATREEVTHVTASMGGSPGRYNLVRSIATPSLAYGELIIDFRSAEDLVANIEELQQEIERQHPDAYVKFKRYNLMYKKYPIEAQFSGPDPAVLHALTDSAISIMRSSGQVAQITTDWEPQVPVINIDYRQSDARRSGLSRQDVSLSLLTSTEGTPIGSFYDGIHRENIYVRTRDAAGQPLENLANAQVFTTVPSFTGLLDKDVINRLRAGRIDKDELLRIIIGSTPLTQVADVQVRWEDPVVIRYNGQRAQSAQCSPAPGYETSAVRNQIAKKIDKIPLPQGYTLTWQGEYAASNQSMQYLFANYPLAVVLIIAILIMLFKDYRKPILIICTIPMVLVGVVAVMLLTGKPYGFVAIAGTLGLIGMIIKNCIVLMDEIGLQISQGVPPLKALYDGSQSRLRAVMMAAMTTVLGMIPLLPDPMFGPLAAAIMGGLTFGTVITLVFLPVLYSLFFKIKTTEDEENKTSR